MRSNVISLPLNRWRARPVTIAQLVAEFGKVKAAERALKSRQKAIIEAMRTARLPSEEQEAGQ
jgi:hypothetical protein